MAEKFGIAFIVIAVSVLIITFFYLKKDYQKQIIAIEGARYRKTYGEYSVAEFTDQGLVKAKRWLQQRNGGTEPKSYSQEIEYIEHFEECNYLVLKKGL